MSQPSNYHYQTHEQAVSKGASAPLINGQPGAAQLAQNGTQASSFNSAGTPSSQSSREPSRDPSPTQYLHSQYRPQLGRAPMPPINGQQSPRARPPIRNAIPPVQGTGGTMDTHNSSVHRSPLVPTYGSHGNTFASPAQSVAESQAALRDHSRNDEKTAGRQDIPVGENETATCAPRNLNVRTDGENSPTSYQTARNVQTNSWSQKAAPNHSNDSPMGTEQTRQNSSHEANSRESRITAQQYATASMRHQQTAPTSYAQPPLGTSTVTATNQRDPLIGGPGAPIIAGVNAQNAFGQRMNSMSQYALPKTSQYPTPEHRTTQAAPGGGQTNQSGAYGSQQNLASQWKYPQAGYPAQTPTGSPRVPGTHYGAAGNPPGGPGQAGLIRAPPSSVGGPPTSITGPPNSFGAPPSSIGAPPSSIGAPPSSIGAPPSSIGAPPTAIGAPPSSIGVPPSSIGAPPSSIGAPPSSIGAPPTSIGAPPTPIGAPPGPPRPCQQPEGPYDYRSPQYHGHMSNVPLGNMGKRYPTGPAYPDQMNQINAQMGNMSVTQTGYDEMWGHQSIDLLQCRNVLPADRVEPPRIKLHQEFLDSVNCSPEIFRCTLTKMPESNTLLQKCRLPLGVLIHPFKDLNHLPVIQCSTIVRCRACRTYINPFVYFVDSKRWKCNLCYRVNELPEEFQFDPVTKSYGDPSRRPEVKTSTIEFIAPSEYMLRPPQPAVYLFVLDVSRLAVDSGYLGVACDTIADELTKLPGDGRTQVGFMAIDSAVHFFSMPENVSQPHELIMLDVDDVFLPCPENLIVNLKEREELVRDLLEQLPNKFNATYDTNSALGAGLQAAFKLVSPTGGRVTVFQTCLPNLGPGSLQPREDPNARASKDVPHLNPATDFYKRLALDYSGQQIAVDLFLLNSQYSDLATLSGMCKFSGGCIYHLPLFRRNKPQHAETLEKMLRRYLTRKIGFEAVMRIRCTRGLSIHTFHGNFFVRSTDLLSLPNVNPDAGFGMQVSIEENLSDVQSVCFQAALLYTSSKGERRIRVHTLCLPVSSSMTDILYSADQQAIVGLLSKMAVDRSQLSSLSDSRDALINVAIDVLSAYKLSQSSTIGGLMAPANLKLLPLYIIALVKSIAFRSGTSTRLDDRVHAMCQMKTLPLGQLMQHVYPDLYPIHNLDDRGAKDIEGKICPQPMRLHLSAEKLDFRGAFLMDAGDRIYIYIGKTIDTTFCNCILGVPSYAAIPEELYDLPKLDTVESERLRNFVFSLQEEKPYYAPLQIIRDDSHFRSLFTERLIEDRVENALSYYEFLQHLKTQVK